VFYIRRHDVFIGVPATAVCFHVVRLVRFRECFIEREQFGSNVHLDSGIDYNVEFKGECELKKLGLGNDYNF